jgi:hypothetical protein
MIKMFDYYQPPELFEIGRASDVISGSVKIAPPPDQIASSNLSIHGDINESDE